MKKIFERISAAITVLASGLSVPGSAVANSDELKDQGTFGRLTDAIRPLFSAEVPRFFAGHRSHSSHASHGSHRSSAGGGVAVPRPPPPVPPAPYPPPPPKKKADPLGQPAKPESTFKPAQPDIPRLANDPVKRANVIRRIQLFLQLRNAYSGPIDGVLGPSTRDAIDLYKIKQGAPRGGYLDADTLTLFGVSID
jgi:His-Xaa-Ser repeat protein HxsA